MAALTVQTVALAGTTLTEASPGASGDTFANDGRTYVLLQNNHASQTFTATFVTPATETAAALSVSDLAVAVTAANNIKVVGPFPKATFNSAGSVSVTYANSSSCTVSVFKLA